MTATVLPGSDVRGLEHGQRVLVRDRARAVIGVEDGEPEACLPEPRRDDLRPAVPAKLDRLRRPFGHVVAAGGELEAPRPEPEPFAAREVVAAPRDDVAGPVRRLGDPVIGREEDRLRDGDAADHTIHRHRRARAREPAEAFEQLVFVGGAVRLAEDVPRAPHGQGREPREEPEAADRAVRRLELEEEDLARLQSRERGRARAPEVDLVDLRARTQELIPAMIGGSDEATHGPRLVGPRRGPGRRPQGTAVSAPDGAGRARRSQVHTTLARQDGRRSRSLPSGQAKPRSCVQFERRLPAENTRRMVDSCS